MLSFLSILQRKQVRCGCVLSRPWGGNDIIDMGWPRFCSEVIFPITRRKLFKTSTLKTQQQFLFLEVQIMIEIFNNILLNLLHIVVTPITWKLVVTHIGQAGRQGNVSQADRLHKTFPSVHSFLFLVHFKRRAEKYSILFWTDPCFRYFVRFDCLIGCTDMTQEVPLVVHICTFEQPQSQRSKARWPQPIF